MGPDRVPFFLYGSIPVPKAEAVPPCIASHGLELPMLLFIFEE